MVIDDAGERRAFAKGDVKQVRVRDDYELEGFGVGLSIDAILAVGLALWLHGMSTFTFNLASRGP